jgi:hypothetical protein
MCCTSSGHELHIKRFDNTSDDDHVIDILIISVILWKVVGFMRKLRRTSHCLCALWIPVTRAEGMFSKVIISETHCKTIITALSDVKIIKLNETHTL